MLQTQEPLTHLPLKAQSFGQRSSEISFTMGGIFSVSVLVLFVVFLFTVKFWMITSLHSAISMDAAPIANDLSPVSYEQKMKQIH